MSEREFIIDYLRCTGCRLCELACAMHHKLGANASRAMIRIVKLETEDDVICIPAKCMHCEKAPCKDICPTKAISTNPVTGARVIDEQKCIGCSACVNIC